jgi:uncharacterized protein YdaU (DUF1376 family)
VNKPPSYPHFAQDWLAGTAHLSLECQGAYKRLCDHEWIDGPLPNDPAKLARLLGVTPRRFAAIWRDLAEHFKLTPQGYWYNDRLEREREIQEGFRVAQSAAGRTGAAKRWEGHRRADIRRTAGAMRLPMADGMANDGLSFSSSPSNPPRKPSLQSRPEGRGGPPQSVARILGTAGTAL